MPRPKSIPTICHHKPSGRAYVRFEGRTVYLGLYGTPESRAAYDKVLAEWMNCGRRLPTPSTPDTPADAATVAVVIAAFWSHAQNYYRRDGADTGEANNYALALRPLRRLYGDTLAAEFGPLKLQALIAHYVGLGWTRRVVNRQAARVRHVFKWATARELVPPSVHHGLTAVSGLKAGRTEAPDPAPIRPVDPATVDATLPFLSRTVATMVKLQLLTGCRPGEVCSMRGVDLDTSGKVWSYRPAAHKSLHHGMSRAIFVGPQGQELIRPFLRPDVKAPLFSPADAEAERREALTLARTTPLRQGNRPGTNRKKKPRRSPGTSYDTRAYNAAVRKAADKADRDAKAKAAKAGRAVGEGERLVPHWHVNQLRHSRATWLRKEFGIEAAAAILGHRRLNTTEVYAERDEDRAREIMGEVG